MLNKKDKKILEFIIRHCLNIEEDISNISEEYFYKDRKTQNSICFDIIQIGELAKSLSNEFIVKYSKMPWKDIKGMRDWVVHGYQTIKLSLIYNTAVNDIKPLRIYLEEIIENNQYF